jgi:hypothetical protein
MGWAHVDRGFGVLRTWHGMAGCDGRDGEMGKRVGWAGGACTGALRRVGVAEGFGVRLLAAGWPEQRGALPFRGDTGRI